MRVDGFRFDLASIFTRRADGSIDLADPPIFGDIVADPHLASLRLSAEPWDAAGAYHLGRDFPGIAWLQWNGRFRDDARRFVRGDPGLVGALMTRLYGSDDLFPDDRLSAYHAYQSVSCVTSHDGFTLYDLVAYNRRRNWANGHGNSNPYNQDNATNWLAWDRLGANRDVFRFFKRMIAFRKAHRSLGRSRFWRDDVRWHGVGPATDLAYHSAAWPSTWTAPLRRTSTST